MSDETYVPLGPNALKHYVHRSNKKCVAMPVLSIMTTVEYVFTTEQGLSTKVSYWSDFNKEYEPAKEDISEQILDLFDNADHNTKRSLELISIYLKRKDEKHA